MELCHGDLRNLIKKRHIFPIPEAISIMTQVLEAFYHIITLGYVHRDLKPENILLKDDLIKVGDFGLSKRYHNRKLLDTAVGTISYQAPQVLLNDRYSYKCDIWAFGLIFFEVSILFRLVALRQATIQGYISRGSHQRNNIWFFFEISRITRNPRINKINYQKVLDGEGRRSSRLGLPVRTPDISLKCA